MELLDWPQAQTIKTIQKAKPVAKPKPREVTPPREATPPRVETPPPKFIPDFKSESSIESEKVFIQVIENPVALKQLPADQAREASEKINL
jgi:hypothetical protein